MHYIIRQRSSKHLKSVFAAHSPEKGTDFCPLILVAVKFQTVVLYPLIGLEDKNAKFVKHSHILSVDGLL